MLSMPLTTVISKRFSETAISVGPVDGISKVRLNGMLGTASVVSICGYFSSLTSGMSSHEARERYVNKAKDLFARQKASFY